MPYTFTMPKLSPTMEEGTIVKWHKKEGEKVEAGDLLIEVSTDKATVEHNALDPGWLRKILVGEGENGMVNAPIAVFTVEKEESIEGYEPEGVTVKPIVEEKISSVEKLEAVSEKKEAQPLTAIGAALQQTGFVPEQPLERGAGERVIASPLAKKIAEEKGIDLSAIKGSGPSGRIMKRDLEMVEKGGGRFATGMKELPTIAPGSFEEESLSPMRKVISQRLQEAKAFIPHFYVQQTVNAAPLLAARAQLREFSTKVSYNDFVVRACALALREHPNINSGFNSANHTLIRFKTIDISIAVSIPDGLITPIVRHADYKSVTEISSEIRTLAKRARAGELKLEEFKGGSFTISNLGMYGVTDFQAIINPPQAAILAVSGIENKPVVKDGQIVPGKQMSITLSADHRVIDGVAAAKFIKTVQHLLENPAALLL